MELQRVSGFAVEHEREIFIESEFGGHQHVTRTRTMWAKAVIAAGLVSAIVLFGVCGAYLVYPKAPASATTIVVHKPSQLTQIVAKPPRTECSEAGKDCKETHCCKVSGFNCFELVKDQQFQCMKGCDPNKDGLCTMPKKIVPLAEADNIPTTSFYCFAVATKDTGSTKPNHEKELLKWAFEQKTSIFNCEEWGLFSDVMEEIAPGVKTVKVDDVKNDFHWHKRKHTGTWVNTGMFVQVWKKIQADGKFQSHDWIIKVDADAVFMPDRLRTMLSNQHVPDEGLYLENCKYVDYGYFGNIEVFSKVAWFTLLANIDTCYTEIDWKLGYKNGKYGPMGEDLFAQKCMDNHGVKKVENFELSTDGTCPGDRPEGEENNRKWVPSCNGVKTPAIHPFKNPDDYKKCFAEANS